MTRINRLVMQGFKSFANRTELVFGNDFNCVLGPNGSGKSNIMDAVCFVLGRISSKSLRAEKIANLIYNGGKKKKPAKRGEVHIFFDNSKNEFPVDTKEVKISRIVSASGQSKYKINDENRTRTEIVGLLSAAAIDPDGSNIVLQGDVTRFIEMSPNDRRQVIEEVAAISVYEDQKKKALRELENVEEQLKSADIILTERKTHLKELKKDRDQALKFKELKEKIDEHKASYIHFQLEANKDRKAKIDVEIKKLKDSLANFEEEVSNLKLEIQRRKEDIKNINDEIECKGEKEQVRLHKEIEQARVDLERSKSRISFLKEELHRVAQRKEQIQRDMKEHGSRFSKVNKRIFEIEKQLKQKEKGIVDLNSKISNFKKKNNVDDVVGIEREVEALDKDLEVKQEEVQKLRVKQQNFLREKDRLEFQLETIDEEISKVEDLKKEQKVQLDSLKNKKSDFKRATLELNKCLDQDSSFSAKLANYRRKLHVKQEEKIRVDARNSSILEKRANSMALRKVLEKKKSNNSGIYGTVGELGKVDKKYSTALGVAAGGKINYVVVESDKVASNLIKFLRKNKFGTASFIPLNKICAFETSVDKSLLSFSGVHGLAVELVNFDNKFRKVFSFVFGSTLVVDSIDVARGIGVGKARMVSLEGDLAEKSGVMTGGFLHAKRVGSFLDAESVISSVKIDKEISDLTLSLSDFSKKKELNEVRIVQLRKEKYELEGEVITLEKTLNVYGMDVSVSKERKSDLNKKVSEIDDLLAGLQSEIAKHNRFLADAKVSRQNLRSKISGLRDPRLLAQLSAFEETKQQLREGVVALRSEKDNLVAQKERMMRPEQERMELIVKQQEKEEFLFGDELKELGKKVVEDQELLKVKEEQSRKFYQLYKELFSRRDVVNGEINGFVDKVEKIRDASRGVEIEMNNVSLKNAEVKAKIAGLEAEFEPYKDTPLLGGKTEVQLKSEIDKFARLMGLMSAVNMKALEIYDQVEAEYAKLLEKKDKLGVERQDVLVMMGEIEVKKKEVFLKTFKALNEDFMKKFELLSHKGVAHLELEDPDNPFDGGLNVKVRFSGQRFLDIKSLSGGEKTMTALAFIFAVQERNPHSFYIMDEVDAALDKHNSEKLAKLVRQYVEKAQYLVISHNDNVISEADNLYGISMNEHGESKVVSIKI